jgi:hypothetical protein
MENRWRLYRDCREPRCADAVSRSYYKGAVHGLGCWKTRWPSARIRRAIWAWPLEEFGDFCAWLALNPEAGDVISPLRRVSQGPLGGRGARQAWWCARHLLQPSRGWNGVVDDLREERSRGHRRKDLDEDPETFDGKAQRKGTGKVRGQPKSG